MESTDTVPSGQDGRTTIRSATAADAASVRALLTDAKLPLDGVPDDLAHFLVAEADGTVVGAIGLEPYGEAALLRSAVVAPAVRGTGLGERLVRALLEGARADGTRELILLTTTADAWFPRFGFERIAREAAPVSLHASEEFRGACPASAVVMRLRI
jgi:amino-acid N-acetyltransferase